jgi:hypothetical protein
MAFDRQMKEVVRYSQARSVGEAKALGIRPSRSALFWLGEQRAYLRALQRWYKTAEGRDYINFCCDMGQHYDDDVDHTATSEANPTLRDGAPLAANLGEKTPSLHFQNRAKG